MNQVQVHIVVAKYKEDISWINELQENLQKDFLVQCFIYDKSQDNNHQNNYIKLPNVGREAHTYLEYIKNNYSQLPNYIVFLQGNPFDHGIPNVNYIVFNIIQGIKNQILFDKISKNNWLVDDNSGYPSYKASDNFDISAPFKEVFDTPSCPENYFYTSGAQFIVNSKCILNRPIYFWEKLHKMSIEQQKFPWQVERLWFDIFGMRVIMG